MPSAQAEGRRHIERISKLIRRRLEETPFLAGGKSESEVRPVIPGDGEEGRVPAFATKIAEKFCGEESAEIRDDVVAG